MTFCLVLTTLLCFTAWISSVHTINGPAANCCTFWSTRTVPLRRIVNYTVQPESPCPIPAIVFSTKNNKRICSDPNSEWARKAMTKVDNNTMALLKLGQNQEGSASDIITPAIAISSKNTPQKKGRKGRRGQWKKKGRKGQ